MSDTIFDVIRQEHDKHRTLLDLLVKTSGDSEGRSELFEKISRELKAHEKAEEMTLYASMMQQSNAVEKARHSVAEHKELSDYLEELQQTDYSNPGWLSTAKKLQERAEHHMEEEEMEVFQVAGRAIDEQNKVALGEEFIRERDAALKG